MGQSARYAPWGSGGRQTCGTSGICPIMHRESWRGLRPQPKFANANRSPSDPASVGARLFSYNTKTSRRTPSTDPVSVVGRLSATRRGYTDAGSVQAKAGSEFSAVAHQSVVHRRRVGGARMPKCDTSTNKNLLSNTRFQRFAVQSIERLCRIWRCC